MSSIPSSLVSSAGLVLGYKVARDTGDRQLGGAVLAAAGLGAFALWKRDAGPLTAGLLTAAYVGAFGGSHPLAKKIGAWPSVATVTAAMGTASLIFGARKR